MIELEEKGSTSKAYMYAYQFVDCTEHIFGAELFPIILFCE